MDLGQRGARGRRARKYYYGGTRAEVARKLLRAQASQAQGVPLPGERLTVGAFLQRWLTDTAQPSVRPRTYLSYAMIVQKHLTPAIGRTPLTRLTPDMVQTYMNQKLATGLSARTVQYQHAVLRRALHVAESWGLVQRNVARLARPPRVRRPEIHPITAEQARAFLAAVADDRLATLYTLALATGLRQGELLGLRWADADMDAATLTVQRTLQRYGGAFHLDEPKTERSRRTVPLPPLCVEALRRHRAMQAEERLRVGAAWQGQWGLVFCTALGEPLSGFAVTRHFQAALARAGLPRQRFHDTRHDAASFMLALGVPLRVVMEVLGHSQIHVTANTYAHIALDIQRDALSGVGALLGGS